MNLLMKTRLVLLIDFSPYTETLIKFAKKWSQLADAEILLIHQIYYSLPAMTDLENRQRIINYEKNNALEKLNNLIRDNFESTARTSCKVIETALTFTLPKILTGNYNDFIIVGTKGAGLFSKFLLGSTTIKVIEKLNYTTIVLPLSHHNNTPKVLTVATHYKFPLNKIDFNIFLTVTEIFIEAIRFISVKTPNDDYNKNEEYLKALQNEYGNQIAASYKIFTGDSISDELKNYIKKNPDTLLVAQKGSRAISDHLFRRFIINELVNDSSLPLIILPV